jgi:hypothetical protein
MEAVLLLHSESQNASACTIAVQQPVEVPKRVPFEEELEIARDLMLDRVAFAAPQKGGPGVESERVRVHISRECKLRLYALAIGESYS